MSSTVQMLFQRVQYSGSPVAQNCRTKKKLTSDFLGFAGSACSFNFFGH